MKEVVDNRVRGLGFNIRFQSGKSVRGMDPAEEGVGWAERLGRGELGLYSENKRMARR